LGYRAPSFHELCRRSWESLHLCPAHLMFTMNDDPPPDGACLGPDGEPAKSPFLDRRNVMKRFERHGGNFCRAVCYVPPFILHGDYVRYLARWAAAFPDLLVRHSQITHTHTNALGVTLGSAGGRGSIS